jgi:hypothetical protein
VSGPVRDVDRIERFGHVASPLERIEEPAPPWLHA